MLVTMMPRLGKLHGQYFIANMPSLTFVPHVVALRKALVDAGKDTGAFDAKAAADRRHHRRLQRRRSLAAVAPYPNLHIVDFKQYVADVSAAASPSAARC